MADEHKKSPEEHKGEGVAEEYKGRGKQAWGAATDDKETEASGKADEAKGKAKQAAGKAKEWVEEKTGKNKDEK